MLAFLADENFHGDIVQGLLRQRPGLDIVRVPDVGLSGLDDPVILAWAAQSGRILLTHDVRTITKFAYERVHAGLAMLGVFEISRSMPIDQAIEEILIVAECSIDGEWEGQERYLPL